MTEREREREKESDGEIDRERRERGGRKRLTETETQGDTEREREKRERPHSVCPLSHQKPQILATVTSTLTSVDPWTKCWTHPALLQPKMWRSVAAWLHAGGKNTTRFARGDGRRNNDRRGSAWV